MDKGEDTRDIIYKERVIISSGDALEETNKKLAFTGTKLLLAVLESLENGGLRVEQQPIPSTIIRARRISSEDIMG